MRHCEAPWHRYRRGAAATQAAVQTQGFPPALSQARGAAEVSLSSLVQDALEKLQVPTLSGNYPQQQNQVHRDLSRNAAWTPTAGALSVSGIVPPHGLLEQGSHERSAERCHPSAQMTITEYRRRLEEIYKVHRPENVAKIDYLLSKYKGKEEFLYQTVCSKYCLTPKDFPIETNVADSVLAQAAATPASLEAREGAGERDANFAASPAAASQGEPLPVAVHSIPPEAEEDEYDPFSLKKSQMHRDTTFSNAAALGRNLDTGAEEPSVPPLSVLLEIDSLLFGQETGFFEDGTTASAIASPDTGQRCELETQDGVATDGGGECLTNSGTSENLLRTTGNSCSSSWRGDESLEDLASVIASLVEAAPMGSDTEEQEPQDDILSKALVGAINSGTSIEPSGAGHVDGDGFDGDETEDARLQAQLLNSFSTPAESVREASEALQQPQHHLDLRQGLGAGDPVAASKSKSKSKSDSSSDEESSSDSGSQPTRHGSQAADGRSRATNRPYNSGSASSSAITTARSTDTKGEPGERAPVPLAGGSAPSAASTSLPTGMSRERVICAIFRTLDSTFSGRAAEASMRRFATLSGFEGSEEEWNEEYTSLCKEWQVCPGEGFCEDIFTKLVNDKSQQGCYCSDQELWNIFRKVVPPAGPMEEVPGSQRRTPAISFRRRRNSESNSRPAAVGSVGGQADEKRRRVQ